MQILVEQSSRDCLAIIIHLELYRYKKLPEGVASGPGDFQRKMENCLQGIPNTIVYLDNIYCMEKTRGEHKDILKKTLQRLQDTDLKVNADKCDFFRDELEILGFKIDKKGLHKSEAKVKAVLDALQAKTKRELQSFLGLVNYYERFLSQRADKLKPLYECNCGDKVTWTAQCEGFQLD